MTEQEMKDAAIEKKGVLLDSINITSGSAAKGNAVALKCYIDLMDVGMDEAHPTKTEIKVQNLLKLRTLLIKQGLIVQA